MPITTTAAATAASLMLFPSPDHTEIGIGPYGFDVAQSAVDPATLSYAAEGLELIHRRIYDTLDPDVTGTGDGLRLRIYRDADGVVQLDHLSADYLLASIRVRPELGDLFDVGLLFGTWEEILMARDTGFAQFRVYAPINVTLLGFSNTDQDDDARLKHYISAGVGLGGEVLTRVVGPLGVQARLEGRAKSTNRHRGGDRNTTRHEVAASAELGVSVLRDQHALVVGGWAEQQTQWEPRDAEGRDGIDRQYLAGGVRISGRFYKDAPEVEPDPELDALLRDLRGLDRIPELTRRGPTEALAEEPLEAEALEAEAAPVDAVEPLLVHWSELSPVEQPEPEWGEAPRAGSTCALRIYLDEAGSPSAIEDEGCAPEMLAPAMQAAWQWRFEPLVEDGAAAALQFVYTWTLE